MWSHNCFYYVSITVQGALDELCNVADLSDRVSTLENPTLISETFNTSCAANTITTVKSITLTKGYWIVISRMEMSDSNPGVYQNIVSGHATRCIGTAGGGCVNVLSLNIGATSVTIDIKAYLPAAVNAKGNVHAIKIGK